MPRFEIEKRAAGAVDGWAAGFDKRRLRELRRGEIEPDVEVDLHGMTRAAARTELFGALQDAITAGQRCVLVVHGRGMRSQDGPVLRDALPNWLAEEPHGASVLAFAAGEAQRGGATYVLLRRSR